MQLREYAFLPSVLTTDQAGRRRAAAISYFQGDTTIALLTWLDIAPSNNDDLPDQNVALPDVSVCIAGFQGQPYPGNGALRCP